MDCRTPRDHLLEVVAPRMLGVVLELVDVPPDALDLPLERGQLLLQVLLRGHERLRQRASGGALLAPLSVPRLVRGLLGPAAPSAGVEVLGVRVVDPGVSPLVEPVADRNPLAEADHRVLQGVEGLHNAPDPNRPPADARAPPVRRPRQELALLPRLVSTSTPRCPELLGRTAAVRGLRHRALRDHPPRLVLVGLDARQGLRDVREIDPGPVDLPVEALLLRRRDVVRRS
mmetsp:Transcript_163/g.563  ORF Transcript_163/g.563 Transcript_163/m.563 type:complete len:230 (-) Transcript_163:303-992(-)